MSFAAKPRQNDSVKSAAEAAHEKALEAGLEYYTDPTTGYLVMTELHHLQRGHCCSNGCRHCPYDDQASDSSSQA